MPWFTYVLPCHWEDHCKVGFSKNPRVRLESFHDRWFEVFDLDRGFFIESDYERDARDLELLLRRPLRDHKAPKPMTVRQAAGGHTEWLRGAFSILEDLATNLSTRGYQLHRPCRPWLAAELADRMDRLYIWSAAQWSAHGVAGGDEQRILECLHNSLDAYGALGLDSRPFLPDEVAEWYFQK